MPKHCQETGKLIDVELSTSASPCDMQAGAQSVHSVQIDNTRPGSIYQVEILVETFRKRLDFNGAQQWLHQEPVISNRPPAFSTSCSMSAPVGSEGSDEVRTTIALYDETQRKSFWDFEGSKESLSVVYAIDVN